MKPSEELERLTFLDKWSTVSLILDRQHDAIEELRGSSGGGSLNQVGPTVGKAQAIAAVADLLPVNEDADREIGKILARQYDEEESTVLNVTWAPKEELSRELLLAYCGQLEDERQEPLKWQPAPERYAEAGLYLTRTLPGQPVATMAAANQIVGSVWTEICGPLRVA